MSTTALAAISLRACEELPVDELREHLQKLQKLYIAKSQAARKLDTGSVASTSASAEKKRSEAEGEKEVSPEKKPKEHSDDEKIKGEGVHGW